MVINIPGIMTSFFGALNGAKNRQDDLFSAARSSVGKAIHETEKYFLVLANGGERIKANEDNISDLWQAAAEPVRRVDAQFADWCECKAEYWLSPDRYTRQEVKELNITLEGLRRRLQDLK